MASTAASKIVTATEITDIESIGELKAQNHHSIQLLHSNATTSNGMPHGLGLLTTVASLPPKYRSRYLSITTKCETPLDLSVKPISPQIANDVPIAASFAEVYTEPSSDVEAVLGHSEIFHQVAEAEAEAEVKANLVTHSNIIELVTGKPKSITTTTTTTTIIEVSKPQVVTPPPTPTKRKLSEQCLKKEIEENCADTEFIVEQFVANTYTNPVKMAKTTEHMTTKRDSTPARPIKPTDTAPKTVKAQHPPTKSTKNKATRKLKFDEETSSPVSGTIIRPLEDITDGTVQYSNGDIDPKYNIVEITEETKAELAAIKNVIGDYICKLCRLKFDDAFGLAQHRCACIVLLEYRCPECGKQFNCPANLASHRRWHKPKKEAIGGGGGGAASAARKENRNAGNSSSVPQQRRIEIASTSVSVFACEECGKGFKRQAYLRKHQLTHNNNNNNKNNNNNNNSNNINNNTNTNRGKKSRAEIIDSKSIVVGMTSARVAAIGAASSTINRASITKRSDGGVYQPFCRDGSSSGAMSSMSSSSSSSQHSYSGGSMAHEEEVSVAYMVNGSNININSHSHSHIHSNSNSNSNSNMGNNIAFDYDIDSMSDCSNSSAGYGRLQIVESGLTEEENIAAAALTNLRNCASVIQHTTLAH